MNWITFANFFPRKLKQRTRRAWPAHAS